MFYFLFSDTSILSCSSDVLTLVKKQNDFTERLHHQYSYHYQPFRPNERESVAIDPGARTMLTFTDSNGDVFQIGDKLYHWIRAKLKEKDDLQGERDNEVNEHPSVKSLTNVINVIKCKMKAELRRKKTEVMKSLRSQRKEKEEERQKLMNKQRAAHINTTHMKLIEKAIDEKVEGVQTEAITLLLTYKFILLPKLLSKDLGGMPGRIMKKLNHYRFRFNLERRATQIGVSVIFCSEVCTSKVCSCCGGYSRVGTARTYKCSNPRCRNVMDRDVNAAINIFRFTHMRLENYYDTSLAELKNEPQASMRTGSPSNRL